MKPDGALLNRYSSYLRARCGRPVRKVGVDAGFTCPNRDGSRGRGGCAWCNNDAFSPARRLAHLPVAEQLRRGIAARRRRHPRAGFIAYFQPFSNTYAPVERLRELYLEALAVPGVVGLAVATRPDCLDRDKAQLLAELAQRAYVQVEIGLQSASDATLRRMGRGHTVAEFRRAVRLCRGRGFDICGHMIAWLPGEGRGEALATARLMVEEGITGIKLHNLHLVRSSRLAGEYARAPFFLPSMQEHVQLACDIVERLPPGVTVQRLAGSAPADLLIAPRWCAASGGEILAAVESELTRRGTRQGAKFEEWRAKDGR